MQPQVRHVQSSDGVRLAVSTLGDGPPLVFVPSTMTIGLEGLWEIPEIRTNLERLAERRKLVQYDARGVGLSSREVEDFSLAALVQDLEAVVDGLGFATVDLFAITFAGPAAISFAARHPDRLQKLVLCNAAARRRDIRRSHELRGLDSLVEDNWELYRQTQALVLYSWTEVGRRWAERSASDISKETYLRSFDQMRSDDVSELLPRLQCATLVMHWRERDLHGDLKRDGRSDSQCPSDDLLE